MYVGILCVGDICRIRQSHLAAPTMATNVVVGANLVGPTAPQCDEAPARSHDGECLPCKPVADAAFDGVASVSAVLAEVALATLERDAHTRTEWARPPLRWLLALLGTIEDLLELQALVVRAAATPWVEDPLHIRPCVSPKRVHTQVPLH